MLEGGLDGQWTVDAATDPGSVVLDGGLDGQKKAVRCPVAGHARNSILE